MLFYSLDGDAVVVATKNFGTAVQVSAQSSSGIHCMTLSSEQMDICDSKTLDGSNMCTSSERQSYTFIIFFLQIEEFDPVTACETPLEEERAEVHPENL